MTLEPTTKAAPHPDVLCTVLETGEAVLLHVRTSIYYSLNETGLRIWSSMVEGLTLDEIGTRLASEFDVSRVRARRSVLRLARTLLDEELIRLQQGGGPPRGAAGPDLHA